MTPRCSSLRTRCCAADVDRPVSLPISVYDIRPSRASSARIRRSSFSMSVSCQDSFVRSARLLLLDTASLYFRAFFGARDWARAADGTPVSAVRGLLDYLATFIADFEPTH